MCNYTFTVTFGLTYGDFDVEANNIDEAYDKAITEIGEVLKELPVEVDYDVDCIEEPDEEDYPISTTIHEFLDFFDFRLEEYDDGYGVIDNQGTDLGNIEGERYKELWQIVERFNGSIYEQDYLVNDLEEEFGYDGDYSRKDMYEFAKQKDIGYANVLYTMMYPQSVTE